MEGNIKGLAKIRQIDIKTVQKRGSQDIVKKYHLIFELFLLRSF